MKYGFSAVVAICVIIFTTCFALAKGDNNSRSFYLVPLDSREQVELVIQADIKIRHRTKTGVIVYIENADYKKLLKIGFVPKYLSRDPALPTLESMKTDVFHENVEVGNILNQLAVDYPNITRRFTLGISVQGRPLHGIVISKNPDTSSAEVEIRILGCHHGNETMSVELPLLMAEYLSENYGVDSRITNLVDNTEFYIVPIVNPDGRIINNRENANDFDLNRNYGYQYHGGVSGAFSQPEVRAVADQHFERNFTLSFTYHTTAAYVNYFWNYSSAKTPDEDLVLAIATRYADLSGLVATQGWDWYQTFGDTNDFSYGTKGTFDYTIETANINIQTVWNKNRPAMLDSFEQAQKGLHGIVKDSETDEPLQAMVLCTDPHWPVYTDSKFGDYHRLLAAGTYDVFYWSPGYQGVLFEDISISDIGNTVQNVSLQKNSKFYAFQVTETSQEKPSPRKDTPSYSPKALGSPDTKSFSLTRGGYVVLDMLVTMEDYEGDELVVHEGSPYDDESYQVYIAENYTGAWVYIGQGNGDQTFDISISGLQNPRYVKILDLGDFVLTDHEGMDLDAVEYLKSMTVDGDIDELDAEIDVDTEFDLENDFEIDADSDSEISCQLPFDCFLLTVNRPADCADMEIVGKGRASADCSTMYLDVSKICNTALLTLPLDISDDILVAPQNCTFVKNAGTDSYTMQGNCPMGENISATLSKISCDGVDDKSDIDHFCYGCEEDGDIDIDIDLDVLEADETELSETDGESLENSESDLDFESDQPFLPDGDFDLATDEEQDFDLSDNSGFENGSGSGDSGCKTADLPNFLWMLLLIASLAIWRKKHTVTARL